MVYFRPKTLHSAYLLVNLQEATNELIEKKSNATTPMSSSSKINLSKEVEKVNSELVGYHECCKANEKSEEIECMGLIALDNICEENVEGNDLESNESSEVDVYCEVRVDKPVWVESKDNSFMVLDEFIHNDGRSKDIEAFDNGFFDLDMTETYAIGKEKELKYMRLQEELKCRRGIEQRGKKMASNKDKIDSIKRYETSNLNKLTKVEEQYNGKQDGSKEGNNYFGQSDWARDLHMPISNNFSHQVVFLNSLI
ncbi:hypothetical protein Tco_1562446 [Tanacetum coccineum]